MHENMSISSEIQDYFERTKLNSLENSWIKSFTKKLYSHSSIHSSRMIDEMEQLYLNQQALQLSIKDFYESFPELLERYSYLDDSNILEDGYVYSQVSFNLFKKEYLLKYRVSDIFDSLNIENSKESIKKKDSLLKTKEALCNLDVYQVGEVIYQLCKLKCNVVPSQQIMHLIQNIEYILELDNLSLSNFLETNPAIKYYLQSRQIIPQIFTRCKKDSLLAPITQESIQVYERLLTQKHIYHLQPDIKLNKFRQN